MGYYTSFELEIEDFDPVLEDRVVGFFEDNNFPDFEDITSYGAQARWYSWQQEQTSRSIRIQFGSFKPTMKSINYTRKSQ